MKLFVIAIVLVSHVVAGEDKIVYPFHGNIIDKNGNLIPGKSRKKEISIEIDIMVVAI